MLIVKQHGQELEEIKKQLIAMTENINKVLTQQATLLGLVNDISELKTFINNSNKKKKNDEKIDQLEQRIDDLEQYFRADEITISGLATTHRSYARVAATTTKHPGEEESPEEQRTLDQQVVQFMNSKNIYLESASLSLSHSHRKDTIQSPVIVGKSVN